MVSSIINNVPSTGWAAGRPSFASGRGKWEHSDYTDLINVYPQVSHRGYPLSWIVLHDLDHATSEAMPTLCKEHVTKSEVAAERLPILHGEQVKTGFVVYDT